MAVGSIAGAAAFAVLAIWLAFGLFAAAAAIAVVQLVRIRLRSGNTPGPGSKRRY